MVYGPDPAEAKGWPAQRGEGDKVAKVCVNICACMPLCIYMCMCRYVCTCA